MKKALTLLLGIMLLALGARAQITHTGAGSVDQRAEAILKRAQAKMSGTVAFNVKATVFGADKKATATVNARVLYSKGRYRMTMDDQVIYCDGTTLSQWNRPAAELVVNPMPSDELNPMNPQALLSAYAKNFRPKYIRTEADGTAVIDLQPRQAASYHKVRLLLDEKSGLLKKIEVHHYDSTHEEYAVTNFGNAKATDADFKFDTKAHPDVDVIDMR